MEAGGWVQQNSFQHKYELGGKGKTKFAEMQMAWVWPIYLNVNKYNVS